MQESLPFNFYLLLVIMLPVTYHSESRQGLSTDDGVTRRRLLTQATRSCPLLTFPFAYLLIYIEFPRDVFRY
jgi:hypothetical protein